VGEEDDKTFYFNLNVSILQMKKLVS